MRSLLRGFAWLIIAAVLASVLLAGFGKARLDEWARQRVVAEIERATGGEAHLGRLQIDLWRLAVELRDLQLEVHEGEERTLGCFVVAARVEMGWRGLAARYLGRLQLAEVTIDQPIVYLDAGYRAPSADEPGELDLHLDRLHVVEGRVHYGDRAIPLEVDARELQLSGIWNPDEQALTGALGGRLTLSEPLEEPLAATLRGRVALTSDALEFNGLEVTMPGSVLRSGGAVSLVDLSTELEGSFESDLGVLLPALGVDEGLEAVADGRIDARFVPGSPPEVGLRARVPRLRFETLAVDALRVDGSWNGDLFRTSELTGRLFGGSFRADARFATSGEARFAAAVDGRAFELSRLLASVGVSLPLDGRVDATTTLEGPLVRWKSWRADGDFVLEPLPNRARGPWREEASPIGLQAAGKATLRSGDLRIVSDAVRGGGAELALALDVGIAARPTPIGLELAGRTSDFGRTHAMTLRILDALGVALPAPLAERPAGTGRLSASILAGETTDVTARFELDDGEFSGETFDRLECSLRFTEGSLSLDEIVWVEREARLEGELALDTTRGEIDRLQLIATDSPAARWATRWLGWPDLGGRVDARIALDRAPDGLNGGGSLEWHDGIWEGQRWDRAAATFAVVGDRVDVSEAGLQAPALDAIGSGAFDLDSGDGTVRIEEARIEVTELEGLTPPEVELEGDVTISGELRIVAGKLAGALELAAADATLAGYALGDFAGRVEGNAGRFDLTLDSALDEWTLGAQIDTSEAGTVKGRLTLDEALIDAPGLLPLGAELALSGALDFSGPLASPESLLVTGQLDGVDLWLGTRGLNARAPIELHLEQRTLLLRPIRLEGTAGDVEAELAWDLEQDLLDLSASGRVSGALVGLLAPDLRGAGNLDFELDVRGPSAEPVVEGRGTLANGRLRLLGLGQTLEQIGARVDWRDGRLAVDGLSGVLGGGTVDGSLSAETEGLAIRDFQLELTASSARLRYPGPFEGRYSGSVAWSGDLDNSLIHANLELERGLYREEFGIGGLFGGATREFTPLEDAGAGAGISLDVRIRADDEIFVRNELARLEAAGDLTISGTADRPVVNGRVRVLDGGEIVFRDVIYQIESANLDFVELERFDPYLTLRARTTVQSYTIVLRVQGTADDFEYELSSTPSLSQQDIIALLATGNTLQELSERGATSGFGGDLAGNYFAGFLTGRLQQQLESLLGLDRLEINPLLLEGETDPTTRVTIGKEVADDVYVIVSNDLGQTERQIYQIEWRASRKLKITAQSVSDGGVGGDLQYTDRFWLNPPPRAPVDESATADSRPAQRLGTLVWNGIPTGQAERMERRFDLREGAPFGRSKMFDVVDALRRELIARGHIEARVTARADPRASEAETLDVEISVDPGPIVEVRFEGVTRKDEKRLREMLAAAWIDSLFEVDLYSDSVKLVLDYYRERGYYAADVVYDLNTTQTPAFVVFEVDRGRPVTIDELTVRGHEPIPLERIERQILSKPGGLLTRRLLKPSVLRDDLGSVRNLYREEGFLEVTVTPPRISLSSRGDQASIEIEIAPGPRYLIREIAFSEDLDFGREQLIEWAGLAVGEPYGPSKVIDAEVALRRELDARGFPDVRVRARTVAEAGDAQVTFRVEGGTRVRVGAIEIRGHRITKEEIIRREIAFGVGDLLSRNELLRTQQQLYRLGIFANVRIRHEPHEGESEGRRVIVEVEEAPPLGFVLAGGYDTEAGARGAVAVTHENLFGRDREGSLQLFASGIEERVQFVATEPRLFGRFPALFRAGIERREETGYSLRRRATALRVDHRVNKRWNLFARYDLQRVDLIDVSDALAVREEKLDDLTLGALGVAVVRDSRDDLFKTTDGSLLTLGTDWFLEPLLSEATFSKSIVRGSLYRTVRPDWVSATSLRIGAAFPFGESRTVPLSERFFAGGDSTLRGFELDQVGPQQDGLPLGGEGLLLVNQELRFKLWRQIGAVVFYDAGNIFLDAGDLSLDPSDWRHVLGAGLRYETPIGPLRFEYGRKLDREAGESSGEFFIAIGAPF